MLCWPSISSSDWDAADDAHEREGPHKHDAHPDAAFFVRGEVVC